MTTTTAWSPPPQPGPPIVITPRQADVLDRIHRGYVNKEIARDMNVTQDTIRTHVKALFTAAGVHTRGQLVAVTCARTVVVRDTSGWAA